MDRTADLAAIGSRLSPSDISDAYFSVTRDGNAPKPLRHFFSSEYLINALNQRASAWLVEPQEEHPG